MLTVSKLSKLVKTTPVSIRYYLRIGLLTPERDEDNGYHVFNANDIRRLKFILLAKGLGFSLPDIQSILVSADDKHSPCPWVRDLFRRRIEENQVRLAELNALQGTMIDTLSKWESMPDSEIDANELNRLIASISCLNQGE